MANADTPHGFNATGVMYGLNQYAINTTASGIFKGDLVTMLATGLVEVNTGSLTHNVGAAESVATISTAAKSLIPASTAGTLLCHYHPSQHYIAQDDGQAVGVQSTIGNNCDITAGTGSATTGTSAHELDASNFATANTATAALVCRINGLLQKPDNAFGANAEWVVSINEHYTSAGTAGI
tara:strand:- start:57 stop:599 length:543 start_codon:yes stop_codon:yes gene_type:complete